VNTLATTQINPGNAPQHPSRLAYNRGCRCEGCRAAAARYERGRQWDLIKGTPRTVDKTGTQRRLQALVALGWNWHLLSGHLGCSAEYVRTVATDKKFVYASTASKIAALYDELSMRFPPEDTPGQKNAATRARMRAKRKGWAPPLAWDNIDDPKERPKFGNAPGSRPKTDVDPAVVDRVIGGERLRMTTAERVIVVQRLRARGLSLLEIEAHTGISKVERYVRDGEAA